MEEGRSAMRGRPYQILAIAILCASAPARADDDAATASLLLAGSGMAIPAYFLGVALHEGSHALAAKAFGADILELSIFPSVRDGHFYFGYTRWRGVLSDGEKAWALLMPKVTNLVLFGGYSALVATDTLPENDYGRLALAVFATSTWVDFSRSVVSFSDKDDLVRVHRLRGRTTEWQRFPYRFVHATLSVAGGYLLYLGWKDVFEEEGETPSTAALVVPLVEGRF
jgi:hypothetical protein